LTKYIEDKLCVNFGFL